MENIDEVEIHQSEKQKKEAILHSDVDDFHNLNRKIDAEENPLSCYWSNWCRLCANDSKQHNTDILFQNHTNSSNENKKLGLKEALEKYFDVQISSHDSMPKKLCVNCLSLVSAIINFNEHVERVQLLFSFLADMQNFSDYFDLSSVRLKFNVTDFGREQCLDRFLSINDANDSNISENYKYSADSDLFVEKIKEVYIENTEMDYDKYIAEDAGPQDKEYFVSGDNEDSIEHDEKGKRLSYSKNVKETFSQPLQIENELSMERSIGQNVKHIASNKTNENKSFIKDIEIQCSCKECGNNFSKYMSYREHMQQEHKHSKSNKYWPCPNCDEIWLSLNNLERHVRQHKPNEIIHRFKCPDCDNNYMTSTQLRTHIRSKHNISKKEKPFICDKCGLRIATSSHFRQHLLIHNDLAPYECDVCKKKFKDKARLKAHIEIHSPSKHVCTICGSKLNSRSTFNQHMLMHSDEIRHKCDYCGRGFKRSNAFKDHLLIHTGLTLFSCNFCEKSFSNRSLCRRHMRKLHAEELAIFDASGDKTHTKNIPKLETLRSVTKSGKNLKPVGIGRYGSAKKKKERADMEAKNSQKLNEQKISNSLQANNEQLAIGTSSATSVDFYHDVF